MTKRLAGENSLAVAEMPEIGIIGGTGGIGRWFADFFQKQGYTVHASGRNTSLTWETLVQKCPVVFISVPISATCDTIRRVGAHLGKEKALMDLTSLKTEPVRAMLGSSQAEVVGLHPLFGPDTPSLEGENIVVCPARGERWLSWIREILGKNGARLHEMTPEKHDKIMAYVQVLPHLTTILLGALIREAGTDPGELEKYSTPVFRARMAMVDKVFRVNPRLYAEILALNPETLSVLNRCEKVLAELKARVGEEDPDSLKQWLAGKGD